MPLNTRSVAFSPMDLKRDLISYLNICAQGFIINAQIIASWDKRPYWRKRLNKHIESSRFVMGLAKPDIVDIILELALTHFKSSRTRSFTILFDNIPMSIITRRFNHPSPYKRFFYYLAIRIKKVKINKLLTYQLQVRGICPWGQVVHCRIPKHDNMIIDLIKQPYVLHSHVQASVLSKLKTLLHINYFYGKSVHVTLARSY